MGCDPHAASGARQIALARELPYCCALTVCMLRYDAPDMVQVSDRMIAPACTAYNRHDCEFIVTGPFAQLSMQRRPCCAVSRSTLAT